MRKPSNREMATANREAALTCEEYVRNYKERARYFAERDIPRKYDPSKPVNGHLEPMEISTAGYDR